MSSRYAELAMIFINSCHMNDYHESCVSLRYKSVHLLICLSESCIFTSSCVLLGSECDGCEWLFEDNEPLDGDDDDDQRGGDKGCIA